MQLKLKEVRESRGWTQGRVAVKAGLSRSYVSELESGKYIPTITTIFKLCRALGCEPNDLIKCKEDR